MDKKIESEKYRKLSVASLVTGILAFSPALIYILMLVITYTFLKSPIDEKIILNIMIPSLVIGIVLAIAAVICGSIDSKKIETGFYSKKGKSFDIAGIVMGVVVILFAVFFLLGGTIFTLLR
jgi:hypothetical protein